MCSSLPCTLPPPPHTRAELGLTDGRAPGPLVHGDHHNVRKLKDRLTEEFKAKKLQVYAPKNTDVVRIKFVQENVVKVPPPPGDVGRVVTQFFVNTRN